MQTGPGRYLRRLAAVRVLEAHSPPPGPLSAPQGGKRGPLRRTRSPPSLHLLIGRPRSPQQLTCRLASSTTPPCTRFHYARRGGAQVPSRSALVCDAAATNGSALPANEHGVSGTAARLARSEFSSEVDEEARGRALSIKDIICSDPRRPSNGCSRYCVAADAPAAAATATGLVGPGPDGEACPACRWRDSPANEQTLTKPLLLLAGASPAPTFGRLEAAALASSAPFEAAPLAAPAPGAAHSAAPTSALRAAPAPAKGAPDTARPPSFQDHRYSAEENLKPLRSK
ncbi:skin secretory protein xP2-like [Schistocerca gregaria]|uniref:skin secretory protein xP2-like n=1 Tax=Schistocerca gregaria TaxID=7010 RepID=UPI00211E1E4E|nr:skin secretory protein xP2-like [Schistocerca gregaria]